MGEGVLYNHVFTEWRHCVSQNEVWERGCYIILFSPSGVTAFHIMKYEGGGVIYPCFHRVTSLRFTEWSMGEGVLYNLVFTEWRHCVSQNEVWGRGCYITLFSPSDVTAFYIMKYEGGGVIYPCFHRVTSLHFTEWSMGEGVLYNLVFTEWRHCILHNEVWGRGCYITLFLPSDVTAFHRMKYGGGGVT